MRVDQPISAETSGAPRRFSIWRVKFELPRLDRRLRSAFGFELHRGWNRAGYRSFQLTSAIHFDSSFAERTTTL
jgi:hypothetical protein